jgi:4-carboxymuconolactone decarboxylase
VTSKVDCEQREAGESHSAPGAFVTIFRNLENELLRRQAVSARTQALMRLGTLLGCHADPRRLTAAFRESRLAGLPVLVLDDLVIHSASYVGFVRADAAHAALLQSLPLEGAAEVSGSTDERSGVPMPQRFDEGIALYSVLDGPRAQAQLAHYEAVSPEYYRTVMATFGCTFGRPGLDVRDRELVTVAVLAAMGTAPKQLTFHTRVALEQGVPRGELAEVLLHTQLYAGLPTANNAAAAMLEPLAAARSG